MISSAQVFRYFVKFNGLGTVEAGDYTLHQKEAMATVVKTLEAGAKVDKGIPLTIPEGLTVPEVAKIVGTLPGRSEARFLQLAAGGTIRSRYQAPGVTSLEGLLLPETYFLDPEKDDEAAILRRMVESFDALATRLDIDAAAARLGVTPYQAVVVASMVEREARVDEDRGKVARADLQPAGGGHADADRRHHPVRPGQAEGGPALQRPRDRLPLQHVQDGRPARRPHRLARAGVPGGGARADARQRGSTSSSSTRTATTPSPRPSTEQNRNIALAVQRGVR